MNLKPYFFILAALMTACLADFTLAASPEPENTVAIEWHMAKQWRLPESPVDIVHSDDGKYVFVLTKESKVLVYDTDGQLAGGVSVGKGVTGIDVSPRAETLYLIDGRTNTLTALSIDFVHHIDISGSPFKGPEDAPVTLALFTDFECPFCRKMNPLLDMILKNNPATVKLVFKNMPLRRLHPLADQAARAALSAHNQGKFWEFHDQLFAQEKLTQEGIEDIARSLALDMEKWKTDMNSAPVRDQVAKDMQDASKADVTGTPTLFINGKLLKGRSLSAVQEIINQELSKGK